MPEIRFDVPADELQVLDGYCQATGKHRVDVLRELLSKWATDKLHESIVVCRMAHVNPLVMESERSPAGNTFGQR